MSAHVGQKCIRTLFFDDLFDDRSRDGFDVGARCHCGVGHDGRRIRIHEDDLVSILHEHLARLGTRVIELAGLPDDDGAAADDENLLYIVSTWHQARSFPPASSRALAYLDIQIVASAIHQTGKRLEEIRGIVRTGICLRMVLHREHGMVEKRHALRCTIVEIDVRELDTAKLTRLDDGAM